MPLFSYQVKDEDGREVMGKAQAETKAALAERLSASGYFVLEIRPQQQEFMRQDLFEAFQGISTREYIMFLTHLSSALEAGLPILKILNTVSGSIKNKKLGNALEAVRADLTGGLSLSEALKKHPKVFPAYFANMVAVGESTGALAESLKSLVVYLEKDEEFRQKTVSVMIYPFILMFIITAVIIFLMAYIMPKFIIIFESAKVVLPLPTLILVAISGFLRSNWLYLLIGIIVLAAALRFYISTRQGRFNFDNFKLRIPLLGRIYRQIYAVRFMHTLSTLYASGVAIGEALSLVEENIGNAVFARVISKLKESVKEGGGIAKFLETSSLFPADTLMMIASGEESGKLPQMLSKAGELYEKDTDYQLKTVAAVMEPAIIVIMGLLVGFVALGILLPVFNMGSAVYR